MPTSAALFSLFRRFTTTMGTSFEIADVLCELCDHAVVILGASGAGVCVGTDDGQLRFVTATGEQTTEMERAQEEHQQGPCMQAFLTGEIVAISHFDDVEQWPAWRAVAAKLDLASVVGLPLAIGGRSMGALNVYDTRARPWTGPDLDAARVLADMAAAYLVRAGALAESQELSAQLQRALDSRVVIEQAKGMLARDHQLSVDAAFALLRQHSRDTNVPLRVIAHAVVELDLQLPHRTP